jgi:hypothetical protein
MVTRLPFAERSFFLEPFLPKGQKNGVWLEDQQGNSIHDRRIEPIYGRVTAIHPTCRYVRVHEWVIFLPNRPVEVKCPEGKIWWMLEKEVLGCVEAGDSFAWFEPEEVVQ